MLSVVEESVRRWVANNFREVFMSTVKLDPAHALLSSFFWQDEVLQTMGSLRCPFPISKIELRLPM